MRSTRGKSRAMIHGLCSRILKNTKACIGTARKLGDCYNSKLTSRHGYIFKGIAKEHFNFKKMVGNSGLSTLSDFMDIEERKYGCIKYMVCFCYSKSSIGSAG